MINRTELLAFEFYKYRPFKGSDNGIRYMLQKEKQEADGESRDMLMAYIWPEPFCFEATPNEQKGSRAFDFSEEGMSEAIAWLNENHDSYACEKK